MNGDNGGNSNQGDSDNILIRIPHAPLGRVTQQNEGIDSHHIHTKRVQGVLTYQ